MFQDRVERRRPCFDEDRVMNVIQHSQGPDGGGSKPSLVELGALIGDPVRAAMLLALGDGSRRPAGELSGMAGASPQAGSAHLARLVAGGLLAVEEQGRHRFFRIASGEVAEIIEGLSNWSERPVRPVRHDPALCRARLCYDHLAGRLGVAVLESMSARGLFAFGPDGPALSDAGLAWCRRFGLEPTPPPRSRRPLLRLCLDWTERRYHLGGHLGATMASMLFASGYVVVGPRRRTLLVTAKGAAFLGSELNIGVDR